jgi:hypothetical protein
MEDIEGETLEEYVNGLAVQARCMPGEQVVAWGRELAGILGVMHTRVRIPGPQVSQRDRDA